MLPRLFMICILTALSAWPPGWPSPAHAADPVIVEENLFSPTRKPEAEKTAAISESRTKEAEPLDDDAIVLKGVSIHGERRWALLAVAARYMPAHEAQKQHQFFNRGRLSGGTMGNAPRRNGRSLSDRAVVVVGEGERLGEFQLDAVGPDYAILSRQGRQFRITIRKNQSTDTSDTN